MLGLATMVPSRIADLAPSHDLLTVFEDCHNAIYANDGLLKDRIFNEITKLLVLKLTDEQRGPDARPLFVPGEEDLHPDFLELMLLASDRQPHFLRPGEEFVLSSASLNYAIRKLASINLSASPGDVKGQAFQTFVYRNQRGDRGEFFTPYPVVRAAIAMLDPKGSQRAIDPACGSGGFLLEILDHIRGALSEDQIIGYVRSNLRGWEFNPEVARSAAVRPELEGALGHEIEVRNSLLDPRHCEGEFDLVATNPPFGSKGKVDSPSILEEYDLARTWKRGPGEGWGMTNKLSSQTPEILFIELCVRLLSPGGQLAIVLPEGLLQNAKVGYVRQWLHEHVEVSGVVSLPQETFIPYGTGIKTSLLIARRLPARASGACFMSQVRRIGYDAKGRPTYERGATAEGKPPLADDLPLTLEGWRAFRADDLGNAENVRFAIPRSKLNSRLDVEHYLPADLALLDELKASGARPLAEHATILKKATNLKGRGSESIRYVAISNIDAATMRVASQEHLLADEAPSRATYELEEGDIVTSIAGANTGTERHASAWVGSREAGAICSNGLAVLRDVRDLDPFYLLAFMRTPLFLRQIRRLRTGHAIPAVSLADLRGVLVPSVSEEEQARVAERIAQMFRLMDQAQELGRDVVRAFADRDSAVGS
jgi:type I restriction enzyme M protein